MKKLLLIACAATLFSSSALAQTLFKINVPASSQVKSTLTILSNISSEGMPVEILSKTVAQYTFARIVDGKQAVKHTINQQIDSVKMLGEQVAPSRNTADQHPLKSGLLSQNGSYIIEGENDESDGPTQLLKFLDQGFQGIIFPEHPISPGDTYEIQTNNNGDMARFGEMSDKPVTARYKYLKDEQKNGKTFAHFQKTVYFRFNPALNDDSDPSTVIASISGLYVVDKATGLVRYSEFNGSFTVNQVYSTFQYAMSGKQLSEITP